MSAGIRHEVFCSAALNAAARSLFDDDGEGVVPRCVGMASGLMLIHATALMAAESPEIDPREALAAVVALAAGGVQ